MSEFYNELLGLLDGTLELVEFKKLDKILNNLRIPKIKSEILKYDWSRIENKMIFNYNEIQKLERFLKVHDKKVYIYWDNFELTPIKIKMSDFYKYYYDIECIGFYTWILCEDFSFFMESHGDHVKLIKL
ncbi:hypothetical protein [Sebaldella sp. S0638]|uniref:CDI toxin immunity protein n=1 Tax=Sebaldella sp. S0638 TaxID=2957809 RepID=UPI0020A14438|nr:hypothetical protein [Sebaldella sp. S0638]MCP1225249.1 hypothetical protein [Sebaldella sp. S0638]